MSLLPEFMRDFERFDAERNRVRDAEGFRALEARWFDTSSWPRKTPAQLADEAAHKRGPVQLGGRSWSFTSWVYDLTPEARYEYFRTRATVGDRVRFPDRAQPTAGAGWAHECPHCEISTTDPGNDECPRCGRALIDVHYAD
jgi:hypothetical protein